MAASTAFGVYWIGSVRKSRTITTIPAVVSWASWLLPPASSIICVLVGLPLTTNAPDSAVATFAAPSPTRSTFSSNRSSYLLA